MVNIASVRRAYRAVAGRVSTADLEWTKYRACDRSFENNNDVYFKEKYNLDQISELGLMVGARDTINKYW